MNPEEIDNTIQDKQTKYCLKWILKALGCLPTKQKDQYLFSLGYNLDMVLLGRTIKILSDQKDYAGLQTIESILRTNLEKVLIIKKEINTEFFKKDVQLNPELGQTMDEMLKKINSDPLPKTKPRF